MVAIIHGKASSSLTRIGTLICRCVATTKNTVLGPKLLQDGITEEANNEKG
jgi:hypothetical protein